MANETYHGSISRHSDGESLRPLTAEEAQQYRELVAANGIHQLESGIVSGESFGFDFAVYCDDCDLEIHDVTVARWDDYGDCMDDPEKIGSYPTVAMAQEAIEACDHEPREQYTIWTADGSTPRSEYSVDNAEWTTHAVAVAS